MLSFSFDPSLATDYATRKSVDIDCCNTPRTSVAKMRYFAVISRRDWTEHNRGNDSMSKDGLVVWLMGLRGQVSRHKRD